MVGKRKFIIFNFICYKCVSHTYFSLLWPISWYRVKALIECSLGKGLLRDSCSRKIPNEFVTTATISQQKKALSRNFSYRGLKNFLEGRDLKVMKEFS